MDETPSIDVAGGRRIPVDAPATPAASAARETVEALTAELAAARAQEEIARHAAKQAAAKARQVAQRLSQARAAQLAAEKQAAVVQVNASPAAPADPPARGASNPARSLAAAPGPQSGRERRQHARHPVDSTARIFLVDVRLHIDGRIVDISPAGCRIRCTDRFPLGIYRRVEVEFVLDGLRFRLPGVVQSLHDRFTTGIRFVNLSERKQEQLLSMIQEISEMKHEECERPPQPATP